MDKKRFDMLQYNYKVIANSFYGNTGTPASRFYFPPIAMSITLFGQEMIKRCKQVLSEKGYEILYSDSVTGNSKILVSATPYSSLSRFLRIDDFLDYLQSNDFVTKKSLFEKEYYILNKDYYTLAYDEENNAIVWGKINKIIVHETNKKLYRLKINDRWYLDVTEDHSIYNANRQDNGLGIRYKPELTTPDKVKDVFTILDESFFPFEHIDFVNMIDHMIVRNVKVEELGKTKGYVYDLEVEDYHNFFANNILVHNTDSTFINVENQIPDDIKNNKSENEIVDYIYEEVVPKLYEIINPELDKLAKEYNVENHRFAMKQEIVGKRLIFFYKRNRKEDEILSAKKRYIAWIVDEEGERTDKLLVRGLEIRRSELSKDIKDRVKDIYEYVLKTEDNEETIKQNIISMAKELKKDILKWIRDLDIEKFAININIKDVLDYKGNTPQYKGLNYYNIIAEIYNLPKVYSVIKGKLIYIKLLRAGKESPIFDYIIKNRPKILNPSKGKEEVILPPKFDSLVISPEISHLIPKEVWNEIKINEDTMLDRIFYGPLTPLFDLFNIERENLLFGE